MWATKWPHCPPLFIEFIQIMLQHYISHCLLRNCGVLCRGHCKRLSEKFFHQIVLCVKIYEANAVNHRHKRYCLLFYKIWSILYEICIYSLMVRNALRIRKIAAASEYYEYF